MMTGISLFIKKLRNIISEDTQSWVLPALRQDPLVWNCLQVAEFSDNAIEILGSTPHRWTPANLSLIALGIREPLTEFLEDPKFSELASSLLDPSTWAEQSLNETDQLAQIGLFTLTQVKHAQESGSLNDLELVGISKSGDFSRSAFAWICS